MNTYLERKWDDICGCQECCPMCGNKCRLPNDNHTQHQTSFHFFPSFKGIDYRYSNKLILSHCFSESNITGGWLWKGKEYKNFDEVIDTVEKEWRDEFPRSTQQGKFISDVPYEVKQCWVGVKELIKQKYPQLVDDTPSVWEEMVDKTEILKDLDEDLKEYN